MGLKEHYGKLRDTVSSGKSPQQRLATFTAGVAGLIEEHADNVADMKSIGAELRNEAWSTAIFAS